MIGAVNVREFPIIYSPYSQNKEDIIDTLEGGEPVQLIFEIDGWGFFRYIKNDTGKEGWIKMNLIYPINRY